MRCLRKGSRCVNLSIDMCNTAAINGHGGFYQFARSAYTGSHLDRTRWAMMTPGNVGRAMGARRNLGTVRWFDLRTAAALMRSDAAQSAKQNRLVRSGDRGSEGYRDGLAYRAFRASPRPRVSGRVIGRLTPGIGAQRDARGQLTPPRSTRRDRRKWRPTRDGVRGQTRSTRRGRSRPRPGQSSRIPCRTSHRGPRNL
jgi:hypothetical protein